MVEMVSLEIAEGAIYGRREERLVGSCDRRRPLDDCGIILRRDVELVHPPTLEEIPGSGEWDAQRRF